MSTLLAVLLLVQAPVHFTPDRVGIRYVQSLPGAVVGHNLR